MEDLDAVLSTPRYAPRIHPTPIPGSGVFDSPAVCVTINDRWVSHLLGLLEVLDQPDAWDGTDEEVFAARQQVRELGLAMRLGNCEGVDMLIRQNEDEPCILETSVDGGTTWTPVADLSLCEPPAPKPPRTIYDDVRENPETGEPEVSLDGGTTWTPVAEPSSPGWFPARSPSPGATQEEQRCAAASRATENLSQFYKATYGAVGAGIANSLSSMNEFLAKLNDVLAGIVFGTYYEIAKAAGFIELYESTQYEAPELDQEAREALACLLYNNASVGAYQVVSFDFGAVRDNVIAALGINPGTAVWTHLNYLGADGLNAYGEAGTYGDLYNCNGLCGEGWLECSFGGSGQRIWTNSTARVWSSLPKVNGSYDAANDKWLGAYQGRVGGTGPYYFGATITIPLTPQEVTLVEAEGFIGATTTPSGTGTFSIVLYRNGVVQHEEYLTGGGAKDLTWSGAIEVDRIDIVARGSNSNGAAFATDITRVCITGLGVNPFE